MLGGTSSRCWIPRILTEPWSGTYLVAGEVSDSGEDSGEEQFYDGYDENLIRDEEDKQRLELMTEKEREQELFDRMERRALLKTRCVKRCI